jgi:hypothetical protein
VRPPHQTAADQAASLPAALVLFSTYRTGAVVTPVELSRRAALVRILGLCPGAQTRPAETMASARALTETAPSWTLERPDTDSVIRALLENELIPTLR